MARITKYFRRCQMTMLTKDQHAAALKEFDEYFAKNYPGPDTVICDPHWHAPRILRAAEWAIEQAILNVPPPSAPTSTGEQRG
jgi:hypothetical protein